ncbi:MULTISPECIES: agmatinase family protein [unclassified Thermoactinomyces]|jgi:formiminoglutamase|uniref:agmatinase family protein n=1 Tax=unclassified Thermoactinomyces TaxID=2634588 RepID=UPI0018DBF3B7|nr:MULTISPECIES: agmatinase family protein [unclassified Thermoactinomyces]MBH8598563.1 agmatinase family protein [Thermoactinomyces sp. CICC 10523]MBH8604593.1 agmatinase family protein [Thermoactinomyces sp. CICC 10522]
MRSAHLNPPPFIHQTGGSDPFDPKVSGWILPWDGKEEMDVGFIGVPLSRSSISASAASEAPMAVRQSWRSFSTYDVDHDVDLFPLKVRDLGDIRMHVTDISLCHRHIEQGMKDVYEATARFPDFLPVIMGGDHSITCPSVKAFAQFHSGKKIGLLQFDTHFDVRSLESGGPSNGTPIRGLIESSTIQGENIVQIGIHGFANAAVYRRYVDEQGIVFFTMREVRSRGLSAIMEEAVSRLKEKVDLIYVTVDIDVLDLSFLPGSPGPSPGGMFSWEMFEAVHRLGKEEQVKALDLVCLDPFRDVAGVSVKTAMHTILSFLSGVCLRRRGVEDSL